MIPEKISNGELAFRGLRFDIRAVDVPGRDGQPHRREIVAHPGAAVVLPLLDEQRLILIRNQRVAADGELWELPAGTLDVTGEAPIDCARRELIEETGYEAATVDPLATFYTSPGICTERMHAFVARDLTRVGQQLEASEDITVEAVNWDQTMHMIRTGQIQDGKTLTVLLLFRLTHGEGKQRP